MTDQEKETQQSYEITELQNNGGALAVMARAEIDTQISTAHAYPRSLTKYRDKAMTMLMLDKAVAEECFYVIPRAGKSIEGPSVRLAEIVAASYGNLRCGARIVAEEADFVVAQGVCHDLENNLAVTFEVKRRITNKNGQRFDSDMIGVTGNAASSIAFRNTVFRVVPKVLWIPLYEAARKVARGDEKTFSVKREATLLAFEKIKVPRKRIFEYLEIGGLEDMNSDHLITLIGIGNAIKAGETSVAEIFGEEVKHPKRKSETEAAGKEAPAPAAKKDDDPFLDAAEVQQVWSIGMNRGLAKVEVKKLLQERFGVDNVTALRKSQLEAAQKHLIEAKKP